MLVVVLVVVVGGGVGGLDDHIFQISCDSPSYRSLFDLNETTGCRTDAACESDAATLHTREAKSPGEQIFHVQCRFCRCNL